VAHLRSEIKRLTRERDDEKDDALRLHDEKVGFFERAIKAEAERDALRRHRDFLMQAISDHKNNVWGDGPVAHSEDENLYVTIDEYVTHEQQGDRK
jgi:hypothetical protein